MTKKMDQFLRHWIIGANVFLVQPSVQVLSLIGIVLVDELPEFRFCGFALAFDRFAKSPAFNFNAYSSNCIYEVSCSLLLKFVTNLFKPWEILTHEWDLFLFTDIILISTPYSPCKQQVVTSNTGPILVFPLILRFRCIFVSWQSVLTAGHWICELWKLFSVFRHEILSDFNNIQESCIRTKFAQSVLLW